jgi:hypothetical protein
MTTRTDPPLKLTVAQPVNKSVHSMEPEQLIISVRERPVTGAWSINATDALY